MSSAVKEKRFKFNEKEKTATANYMRIMTDLSTQIEGLNALITIIIQQVKQRVKIDEEKLPEHIERQVKFDPKTFEIVVSYLDHKKLKEMKQS